LVDGVTRYTRVLQFRAGPQSAEFTACEAHKQDLMDGTVSNFFADPADLITSEDLDDDEPIGCYFCREG